MFFLSCFCIVRAEAAEAAFAASRVARPAHVPPVTDQVDVQTVPVLRGDVTFQYFGGAVPGCVRGHEAEPLREAVDVRVHGKGVLLHAEEEDAVGGLPSHPLEGHEPFPHRFLAHPSLQSQVVARFRALQGPDDGVYPFALDTGEAAYPYRIFDDSGRRGRDGHEVGEFLPEARERPVPVDVGCVLREDGQDELLEEAFFRAPDGPAVIFFQ